MPQLINKKTGKQYFIESNKLEAMKKKPHIMVAFVVKKLDEPDAVRLLKEVVKKPVI